MPNKGQKESHIVRNVVLAFSLVGLVTLGMYLGNAFGMKSYIDNLGKTPPPPGGTTGTYSGIVYTPMTPSVTQSPVWFDCTLHQHKAGFSYTSASSFVDSTIVDDVSDLNSAVFAAARLAGYDGFWVTINGTVENNVYTFNDDYGPRTYYAIDFEINENGPNVFNMYATPNAGAGFTLKNLDTGAAITTANITAGLNFSITQFLNNGSAGAYDQKYVGYKNYYGLDIDLNVLALFSNKTGAASSAAVEIGDLVASNMIASGGAGSRNLDFHLSTLGQTPVTSNMIWGDDAVALDYLRIVSPNSLGLVQRYGTTGV